MSNPFRQYSSLLSRPSLKFITPVALVISVQWAARLLLGWQVEQPSENKPEQALTTQARTYPREITWLIIGPNSREPKSPKPGTIVYRQQGKGLGSGGTAFVELLPSGQVIKIPKPDPYSPTYAKDARDNMRFEAKIYDKLGEHPRIPKIFGWDESSCSLKMEYMEHGNLREYMRQHREAIPSQVRPKWARQAAEGVRLLHENNVVHCDISPRNFLLDHELDLKICDFGGSSLNGSRPTAYMSTRYCPPNYKWDDTPQPRDDIFSLGSLIYFIMTNEYPYEEVPSEEVETQYNSLQFPDVSEISCGSLILDCWHRRIDAVQVCEELARQSS